MIVGIGIDVCDVGRFERSLSRTPAMREKLFTPAERTLPVESLAARFAAKEALAKALGAPPAMSWQDAEVVRAASGEPAFEVTGTVQAALVARGGSRIHVSLSHDGGLASAMVVVEALPQPSS